MPEIGNKKFAYTEAGKKKAEAYAKDLELKKASKGTFTQKLQPYDGSYIQGELAGHKVANASLNNYYKDLL